MINLLIALFIFKILDNILMTYKSIALFKGQKLVSSILTVINQLMFYFIISKVIADNTLATILTVSVASGIGNYLAVKLSDKIGKDNKYTNIITSSNIEFMFDFNDYLIGNKIKCVLNTCLTRNKKESYSIIVFANTKEQSKLIDEYLGMTKIKHMREVLI